MQKRWRELAVSEEKTSSLQKALGINNILCKLLVARGITDFASAKKFFRPDLASLHSPWLMRDMDKAVARILEALKYNEKILIYGDYDVDGTTSVAVVYKFLQNLSGNIEYYIPHRYKEGYGISKQGIDYAALNDISLIISLDCGIKSIELVEYAKLKGIEFIICDHHLPDDTLPDAIAILNPKQPGCDYPYKELCGCGVGFKLVCALQEKLGFSINDCYQYLDLVAIAIAADIVPITGENRIMVFFGLKKLNSNPVTGVKALLKLAAFQAEITVSSLVFVVAPRINAAGRMDEAIKAVKLFIEEDFDVAMTIAEQLHDDNTVRRTADSSITEEAIAIIDNNENWKTKKSTVVYSENWHKGVVGIVASRLIERYYRPTIVLTRNGDYAVGSARSIAGFNLYEAIHTCKDHLIGYGGHFAAAGMTMKTESIEAFSQKFEQVVSETIDPKLLVPELVIDTEIQLSDITSSFYNILKQMEPFGPGNMRPVFIIKGISDTRHCRLLKDQHIKFCLKKDKYMIDGIGFNMADKFHVLQHNKPIDVVFTIDQNSWNGNTTLQLRICDFKLSEYESIVK